MSRLTVPSFIQRALSRSLTRRSLMLVLRLDHTRRYTHRDTHPLAPDGHGRDVQHKRLHLTLVQSHTALSLFNDYIRTLSNTPGQLESEQLDQDVGHAPQAGAMITSPISVA